MITIQLNLETSQQPADMREELVLAAVACALAQISEGCGLAWSVQQLSDGDRPRYALLPIPGSDPSSNAVWAMAHALRDQPQIAAADPWDDEDSVIFLP